MAKWKLKEKPKEEAKQTKKFLPQKKEKTAEELEAIEEKKAKQAEAKAKKKAEAEAARAKRKAENATKPDPFAICHRLMPALLSVKGASDYRYVKWFLF